MGIDPFRELERMRRDMDRLLGETRGGTSSRPFRVAFLPGHAARQYPWVNIYQDGDDFRVVALAPGVDPNGVEVTAVRNTLTIRGEKAGYVTSPRSACTAASGRQGGSCGQSSCPMMWTR